MIQVLEKITKEFILLFIEVLPFFILGCAVGAFLDIYARGKYIVKYLNKGIISIFSASLLGIILPGCSCATIPMAQGIKEKGSSLSTIATFIMASPLLSPQTAILTYAMLGWKFTIGRIVFSLVGSIFLGFILYFFENNKIKGISSFIACNDDNCEPSKEGLKKGNYDFLQSFTKIMKDLGKYFLFGMAIASILTVVIPKEAIPKYIGTSGFISYIIAAFLGIPLYVCEGEEIPLALAFLKLNLGAGPVFTFLLGSVGTCIPTMIMAQKIIGKGPTLFYIIFWFIFAIGSGIIFNEL